MTATTRETGRIVLGPNQYGKAECRLVHVTRDPDAPAGGAHRIEDLTVTSQLRGDFTAAHTVGDNARVVPTDTQKNTAYALAREHGIGSPEEFLMTLSRHFTDSFDWVTGGRWEAEQHAWDRIGVDEVPHDHAFVRQGRETRTCVVRRDEDRLDVVAGLRDCTVLKSTGSEFHGFPRDRFTTLPEADDRILATSVTAWWRYAEDADLTTLDFNATYDAVRDLMLARFADLHSLALQQTIFAMGQVVLETFPTIAEVRLSCPNKHHFLVDLEPFGLDNPQQVFFAADRPYGLIEAAVQREGAPQVPEVWSGVPGAC